MPSTHLSAQRTRKQRRNHVRRRASPHASFGTANGLLIGLLLWSTVLFLFYAGGTVQHTDLTEGQRARNTIVASIAFQSADEARTELLKQQAADDVLPVFSIDQVGLNTALRSLTKLYERMDQLRQQEAAGATPEVTQAAVTDALFLLSLPLNAGQALALAPPESSLDVLHGIRNGLQTIWLQGILSEGERQTLFSGAAAQGAISVLVDEQNRLRSPIPLDDLPLPADAAMRAARAVADSVAGIDLPAEALETLLAEWTAPNLRYDSDRTEFLRTEARKNVDSVQRLVPAGTTIVEAGERISMQVLDRVLAHQQRMAEMISPKDRILDMLGNGCLLLLGLIVAVGMMRIAEPALLKDSRTVTLFAILSLLGLVPAKVLLHLSSTAKWLDPSLVEPLLPLALAPLLATVLVGARSAVIVGIWSSMAVAIFYGHSFALFVTGIVVTTVAALLARNIRRRAQLFRIGISVGLATIACVLCMGALNQQSGEVLVPQLMAAAASGLFCALLAGLLIPVLEWTFGYTSDITLLELSDMGHPLLQRMAIEAPGTYHHSLMVANLSQSAAAEIDANPLRVRVCAYYHDIGKLTKPEFFVENNQFAQNPHDDLSPSMSALVLISHVKEGLALARRYKLPRPILQGIEQHHGTGLIYYFYHRALKQMENEEDNGGRAVSDADFRYPGPRPQSREMGVLLLADSVEAASRSMEKPTAARIEALVNDIVDARMNDGQLDACDLTFAQLAAIKQSFLFTLTNMLHGRVAYPKHEDRNKQPTKPSNGQSEETPKPQPVAHAAG
jgi:putative nucleotidyltransferase with HDIG domain